MIQQVISKLIVPNWLGIRPLLLLLTGQQCKKAFIFEGLTEQEICNGQGSRCIGNLRSFPEQNFGMILLKGSRKYYIGTHTQTYAAYQDAVRAELMGDIGDTANSITVVCPICAPVSGRVSLFASIGKIYYEPTLENWLTPLTGMFAQKAFYRSGRLSRNQSAVGGAGVELGIGLINDDW